MQKSDCILTLVEDGTNVHFCRKRINGQRPPINEDDVNRYFEVLQQPLDISEFTVDFIILDLHLRFLLAGQFITDVTMHIRLNWTPVITLD